MTGNNMDKVLALRCCAADGSSSHGFRWPRNGAVAAPDWVQNEDCGNGLHGWLWGAGDISVASNWADDDALWLVVEVIATEIVDLKGKVKFPRGEVLFAGSRDDAIAMVAAKAPAGTPIMFGTATAGDRGTATAGDRGTATAGKAGRISIAWYDAKRDILRTASAEIAIDDEDTEGLKPNVKYRIDVVDGKPLFVEAN